MKKLLCFTLLCAALVLVAGLAVAQDSRVVGPSAVGNGHNVNNNTKPSYCKPCLFYGGDWDPNASNWSAYGNANNTVISDVYTNWVAFKVPKTGWKSVTGLFTNNLAFDANAVIDPVTTPWFIAKGITEGVCGKNVKTGKAKATWKQTGRNYSGVYYEFYDLVKFTKKPVTLKPGTYWIGVSPQCTNSSDSACTSYSSGYPAYFYNTDSTSQTNKFGPAQPVGMGFINGEGYTCNNDCDFGYGAASCDYLSGGVLGTK